MVTRFDSEVIAISGFSISFFSILLRESPPEYSGSVLSRQLECIVNEFRNLVIRHSVMSVMARNLTYANSEHRMDCARYMAKCVISLSFPFRKLRVSAFLSVTSFL